ncbi:MAG: response regulator transcription factor [Cytophagaceae bacterium]|jgi:DNA-binding NarL/FixJ family response regulator|nr:response regulator transcription factor [Cytophagaceae bacterium]
MKKVIIIEDNLNILHSVKQNVESTGEYKVIRISDSVEYILPHLENDQPDFIIMDIRLKGSINGIEGTFKIKKVYPNIDILMFTVFDDNEQVFEALRAGACGYISKNASDLEMIHALHQAGNGGAPMSNKIARQVLLSFQKNRNSPLSKREDDILNFLAKGNSYKSIANTLCISSDTVKYHIKNIYFKLQVSSKEEAIEKARKENWI